mmetsp:Transcript_18728/g.47621  ORF Transcript_18728/g.47621 Transcript_18728/m.47621 type:complete len:253 (-) Transcript_18728:47-805(-)
MMAWGVGWKMCVVHLRHLATALRTEARTVKKLVATFTTELGTSSSRSRSRTIASGLEGSRTTYDVARGVHHATLVGTTIRASGLLGENRIGTAHLVMGYRPTGGETSTHLRTTVAGLLLSHTSQREKTLQHHVHVLVLVQINHRKEITVRYTKLATASKEVLEVLHHHEGHRTSIHLGNGASTNLVDGVAKNNTTLEAFLKVGANRLARHSLDPVAEIVFESLIVAGSALGSKFGIEAVTRSVESHFIKKKS